MSIYSKFNEIQVSMDKGLIDKDINRLSEELKITKNKFNKSNLEFLIQYLKKLEKKIVDGSLYEFCWQYGTKDNLPSIYPLEFINEPLYKIATVNYLTVGGSNKLVEIDLSMLADIIAFEIMFKDLGETHESMEEILKDCGILGLDDTRVLEEHFKLESESIYDLSKKLRVSESPYLSSENGKLHDYFHTKDFNGDSYKDVVNYSCRYATAMILASIIRNAETFNLPMKPLMASAKHIAFMVTPTNKDVDIKEELIEKISVRTFGRKFLVKPIINII